MIANAEFSLSLEQLLPGGADYVVARHIGGRQIAIPASSCIITLEDAPPLAEKLKATAAK
jgi:hypothetical protein